MGAEPFVAVGKKERVNAGEADGEKKTRCWASKPVIV